MQFVLSEETKTPVSEKNKNLRARPSLPPMGAALPKTESARHGPERPAPGTAAAGSGTLRSCPGTASLFPGTVTLFLDPAKPFPGPPAPWTGTNRPFRGPEPPLRGTERRSRYFFRNNHKKTTKPCLTSSNGRIRNSPNN